MTPAGAKLDRLCVETVERFNWKREVRVMPEIGGKALATQVRVGFASLKKELEALKLDAAGAVTEFVEELRYGKEGVKRLREETAEVRKAFGEIMGNERAESETKVASTDEKSKDPGVTNGS